MRSGLLEKFVITLVISLALSKTVCPRNLCLGFGALAAHGNIHENKHDTTHSEKSAPIGL